MGLRAFDLSFVSGKIPADMLGIPQYTISVQDRFSNKLKEGQGDKARRWKRKSEKIIAENLISLPSKFLIDGSLLVLMDAGFCKFQICTTDCLGIDSGT